MISRKRKRESDMDENSIDMNELTNNYIKLSGKLLIYLKSKNLHIDTFKDDYPQFCELASQVVEKYWKLFPETDIDLLLACAYMFILNLHNDDADYIDYKVLRIYMGFKRSLLDREKIYDVELRMCKNFSSYIHIK